MARATLPDGPAPAQADPAASAARPRLLMGLLWATWALCAALAVGFLTQPVGLTAQGVLCAAAGAGMVALWLLFPAGASPGWRSWRSARPWSSATSTGG
ncbi:hypothetical protein ACU4GR_25635 [Methylobacterium oryzae CBMB20]